MPTENWRRSLGAASIGTSGPPLLPVRNKRYTSGVVDLNDGRQLYINRALGNLLPVRFNMRPEVTIFALTRA